MERVGLLGKVQCSLWNTGKQVGTNIIKQTQTNIRETGAYRDKQTQREAGWHKHYNTNTKKHPRNWLVQHHKRKHTKKQSAEGAII